VKTDQLRVHDPNCKGCKRCAHFYRPFPHASFCQQVPCKCGATKRREEFEKELAPWFESLGITKEMRQEAEENQVKSMTELVLRDQLTDPAYWDPSFKIEIKDQTKYVFASGDPDAIKIDPGERSSSVATSLTPTVGENSPTQPTGWTFEELDGIDKLIEDAEKGEKK